MRRPTQDALASSLLPWLCIPLLACPIAARAADSADSTSAATSAGPPSAAPAPAKKSFLPLLAEEATKRGIELPLPFGAGLVYYHLDRAIAISDVRVGRNGAPPTSVSQFAQLSSSSNVDNENLKLDAWLLPFLNLYAVVGYVKNHSDTRIDVTLPPLLPGGPTRQRTLTVQLITG